MIEEFWRSSNPASHDDVLFKRIDLAGCTLLLELEGDLLVGMKDGTILSITGQSELKEVEQSPYGDMIKCPVMHPLRFRASQVESSYAEVAEIDYAYFKVISIRGLVERFAFVPKVARWFIDTTRKIK